MNPLLLSKYSLFYSNTFFPWYFDVSESSHLLRNILFLIPNHSILWYFRHNWVLSLISKTFLFLFRICSFLWYFDISESSHLCRNAHFYCFLIRFSYDISGKWILSLIPRYLLSSFCALFCSILLRYKWILSFIPRYPFFFVT